MQPRPRPTRNWHCKTPEPAVQQLPGSAQAIENSDNPWGNASSVIVPMALIREGFGLFSGHPPGAGDNPEDVEASSTLVSLAFIPPCIRGRSNLGRRRRLRTASLGPDTCISRPEP